MISKGCIYSIVAKQTLTALVPKRRCIYSLIVGRRCMT